MSRDFDGVDDVILSTITAIDTGDWTLGCYGNPDTAGEGSNGALNRATNGTTSIHTCRLNSSTLTVYGDQNYSTTIASTITTTTLALGAWWCVFVTFLASDSKCRIYIGSLSAAMAEASYASQTAGVGTRTTGGIKYRVGNNDTAGRTWDGKIGMNFLSAREWTLAEMEAFRLGVRPVQDGNLRVFLALDSPTASQAEDLSGNGANGTVTGALVAVDPPIPMGWGEEIMNVPFIPVAADVLRAQALL